MPSIIVETSPHPRGWIMIPVWVCSIWQGFFVLNTFRPTSLISASTATTLDGFQCLRPSRRGRSVLDDLTIGGHPVFDLDCRISPAAGLLGVEGMLGLDFINRIKSLHFDVAGGRLTLELP